ncbi:PQ loop repeat-domain-containing protein [Kalaharituber pfeilii]|nr:PQ loop repeat-domain-containing protein [Kalaharituber pfeilii]
MGVSSSPAASVLATIGTICWCIQLIPQIWYNWRRRSTDGLPAVMMVIWAVSGMPFGIYAIIQDLNIPLQCQPHIFGLLSLITWGQILKYTHKFPSWKAIAYPVALGAVIGSTEAACILPLKTPYRNGVTWPLMLIGIIAAILLASGLVPPYFEIAKHHGEVIGISFAFLTVDFSGALFSLLSLVVDYEFDIFAGVMYVACILLELGIFGCHLWWLTRMWLRKRSARKDEEENGRGNGTLGEEGSEGSENGTGFIDEKDLENKDLVPMALGDGEGPVVGDIRQTENAIAEKMQEKKRKWK